MDLDTALARIRTRHIGTLATTKRDGRPHLTNIAFALGDDGVIRISITDDRVKTKNLRRDSRASLHVQGDNPWAYVVLDGDVDLSPVAADPADATVDELVEQYKAVGGEHDNWDEFRQAMVTDKRLLARLRLTHAYGMWPDG